MAEVINKTQIDKKCLINDAWNDSWNGNVEHMNDENDGIKYALWKT